MKTPINFEYLDTFDINVKVDGKNETLTVLTLDKAGNDSYWKRLSCFSALINELGLDGPEEAEKWVISKKFATHPAVIDFAAETLEVPELKQYNDITPVLDAIYGVPVEWTDDEIDRCSLVLKDGKVVDNEHWK